MNSAKVIDFFDHSWTSDQNSQEYIGLIPCDLNSLQIIHSKLEGLAKKAETSRDDLSEILLLCDELISNAMIATASTSDAHKHVVFRAHFEGTRCRIIVFDYGGGLNLREVIRQIPKGNNRKEYLENLELYKERTKLKIKKGRADIQHNRFGKGLKIISNISDILDISYHDEEGNLQAIITPMTIGTVITSYYLYKS